MMRSGRGARVTVGWEPYLPPHRGLREATPAERPEHEPGENRTEGSISRRVPDRRGHDAPVGFGSDSGLVEW